MEEITNMLRGLLDEQGRLTRLPAKRKKQLAAACYLAGKLDENRAYTEKEISEALCLWHTFSDPATLRRDLVDLHFVSRSPDGRAYRLNETQPTLEELLALYQ